MTTNTHGPLSAPSTRNASRSLSILDHPQVREVLSRLYEEADVNDANILAEEQVASLKHTVHIGMIEMMGMLRTKDGKGDWFTVTDTPASPPKN